MYFDDVAYDVENFDVVPLLVLDSESESELDESLSSLSLLLEDSFFLALPPPWFLFLYYVDTEEVVVPGFFFLTTVEVVCVFSVLLTVWVLLSLSLSSLSSDEDEDSCWVRL